MAGNRSIAFSLFSVVVLSALLPTFTSAAEPSPWLEVHSTHYAVITDAGEKRGREVALRFEQMRAVFATLLMKDRLSEPLPLTILAFKDDKTYFQSAPLIAGQPIDVPGFFLLGEDQNFIVLNLFEPEPWRAVAYDFAHLLLKYNYPPAQGWFDEGLAEYFSSIRVDDKNYEIGGDPELHPATIAGASNESHAPQKSLTELLGGQVWLALPDLLTMKHDTAGYTESTRHTLFCAQSWMIMHYLISEKRLPQTGDYFNLVENQHIPVEEAVEKAYGMTPAQFDAAVKTYFHSLTPLFVALDASKQPGGRTIPQVYQFPEIVGPNDSAITTKAVPEREAQALVAEVKIRIPDRREAGLNELHALATTPDPAAPKPFFEKIEKKDKKSDSSDAGETPLVSATGNETAHRVLAWDHIQHSEFDAASEELNDAASLNPRDMWIRYYLCVLKYRTSVAKHADIVGLPNMMLDLRTVLEWYPEFADAYDLMAIARREGGGAAAAMQAERAAMQLSPRNQQYIFHLAEIYISDKKFDAAHALLERLKSSYDAQVAAAARERLTQLPNEQKYGLTAAAISSEKQLAPQKSPFDVLEEDAAKRAAAMKTSQSASTADTRPAKFLQGRLIDVDCSQPPAAVLTVRSAGTTLKLHVADYKSLLLIGADSFSCSWNDRAVSVNYKPGGVSDGDVLSVELR